MKPPKFRYLRAASVDEALDALRTPDAKLIAGGQSLVPMLNFRLLRPSMLVDVNRVPGLDAIEETPGGGLRIGALARHHKVEMSPLVRRRFPVLAHAVKSVSGEKTKWHALQSSTPGASPTSSNLTQPLLPALAQSTQLAAK